MPVNGRNNWRVRQLGDVIELFDHKRVPLNSRERQRRQGEYPYYGAQGVIDHIDGYMFDGRYTLVAEDGENLNSRKLPLALFADGKFWVNNHAHVLRAKPDVADDVFLLAWLNQADIKPYVTGAAQPKLSQSNLRLIEIPLPPLAIQRQIAGLVSTYDDLIVNNTRRIQILERMAQAIYREWFVNFRFPGHAKVKLVAPTLGQIPQGWQAGTFSDIAEVSRSGLSPAQFPDEQFSHYSIPAFDAGHMPRLERGETILSNKFLLEGDRVLVSKLNPRIPRIWLTKLNGTHRAVASTEFLALQPRSGFTLAHLFCLCSSEEFQGVFAGRALGTSTSHQRVKPEDLMRLPTILPTKNVVGAFNEQVEPMLALVHTLRVKNANLRRTRDLLLPKLISGTLDVSKLEIENA